jgi:hypothetical protein
VSMGKAEPMVREVAIPRPCSAEPPKMCGSTTLERLVFGEPKRGPGLGTP